MGNSISEEIKQKHYFKYNTAYEIYKIISTQNKYLENEKKSHLKWTWWLKIRWK